MSPIASEGIAGPALDDAGVRLNRRLPARLVVGTATAISVVVLLAALAWVALQEQYRAREATMATLTTDAAINAVMKGITDAETGQRGFLLTQREDYLQPFLEARTRLRADMESLLVLMQGDREQLQRAQALRELVLIRLDLLQQVVDLQRADDHEGAVALVAAGRGKQLMDEVRTIAAGMLEAERDRLVFSYAELERSRLRSVWTVFGGLGVLLFLVLVGGLVAAREVRRKQVEDWLRASQASLAAAVQGEHRIEALGEMVLRFMTGQLRAPVAAFHARVAQGRLQRVAGYALAGGFTVGHCAGRRARRRVRALRPGDGSGRAGRASQDGVSRRVLRAVVGAAGAGRLGRARQCGARARAGSRAGAART